MKLLVAGVLVFALVHMVPAGAAGLRNRLIDGMGENAYKGIFTLLILGSIVAMVFGWKATTDDSQDAAALWMSTFLLLLAGSILFFAPYMASNLRRAIRHPQLMGVALFGAGHLIAVSSARSLVLFGGLALWALLEMLLLNRRDGAREKPGRVPRSADFKLMLAGLLFFLVLLLTHEWLFGVAPVPPEWRVA